MKKKIAKKEKSKFLKNLSPVLGIILILAAIAVFAVAVRSNMTGNVPSSDTCDKAHVGNSRSKLCFTSDCYYGAKYETCRTYTQYSFFCWLGCERYHWVLESGRKGVCEKDQPPHYLCNSKQVCNKRGGCYVPQCAGKNCGNDGYGGSCGTCSSGKSCYNGVCKGIWGAWSCGTCSSQCLKVCTRTCHYGDCPSDGSGSSKTEPCTGGSCSQGSCGDGTCSANERMHYTCPLDCY